MQTVAARPATDVEFQARRAQAHGEAIANFAKFLARFEAFNLAAKAGNWREAETLLAQERVLRASR
jgi:hypothetical protein